VSVTLTSRLGKAKGIANPPPLIAAAAVVLGESLAAGHDVFLPDKRVRAAVRAY
jgi:hypothetical protein